MRLRSSLCTLFRPAESGGALYRTGAGKDEIDLEARRAQDHWDSLSTKEKILDTAARHEYGIIGGAWATSMAGASAWIMRDKFVLLRSL